MVYCCFGIHWSLAPLAPCRRANTLSLLIRTLFASPFLKLFLDCISQTWLWFRLLTQSLYLWYYSHCTMCRSPEFLKLVLWLIIRANFLLTLSNGFSCCSNDAHISSNLYDGVHCGQPSEKLLVRKDVELTEFASKIYRIDVVSTTHFSPLSKLPRNRRSILTMKLEWCGCLLA